MSTAFEKFPQSCVKTLVMTTGEFEFDKIFFSSTVSYPYTTYILWIIFIILMPILFNNLLVSIYVAIYNMKVERRSIISDLTCMVFD